MTRSTCRPWKRRAGCCWPSPQKPRRRAGRPGAWTEPPLVLTLGGGEGVDQFTEFGELDGLGEVGERAAGQQAADDATGGVGGKDHHGNGGGGGFGLEFAEYLVSVQVRQVQVEQDEVRKVPDGAFEAGPARCLRQQPEVRPAPQEPGYHLDVRRVVLDVENAEAACGRGVRPARP